MVPALWEIRNSLDCIAPRSPASHWTNSFPVQFCPCPCSLLGGHHLTSGPGSEFVKRMLSALSTKDQRDVRECWQVMGTSVALVVVKASHVCAHYIRVYIRVRLCVSIMPQETCFKVNDPSFSYVLQANSPNICPGRTNTSDFVIFFTLFFLGFLVFLFLILYFSTTTSFLSVVCAHTCSVGKTEAWQLWWPPGKGLGVAFVPGLRLRPHSQSCFL